MWHLLVKAFLSIWGWNQFLQHLFWLLPFQGQALAFVRIAGQLLPVSYCQWKHWIMVRVMKQGRKGCNWPCTARQPPVLKTFLGGTEWLSGRKKTYQKGWVDNSSATISVFLPDQPAGCSTSFQVLFWRENIILSYCCKIYLHRLVK